MSLHSLKSFLELMWVRTALYAKAHSNRIRTGPAFCNPIAKKPDVLTASWEVRHPPQFQGHQMVPRATTTHSSGYLGHAQFSQQFPPERISGANLTVFPPTQS